jgi:hypothetical protein
MTGIAGPINSFPSGERTRLRVLRSAPSPIATTAAETIRHLFRTEFRRVAEIDTRTACAQNTISRHGSRSS